MALHCPRHYATECAWSTNSAARSIPSKLVLLLQLRPCLAPSASNHILLIFALVFAHVPSPPFFSLTQQEREKEREREERRRREREEEEREREREREREKERSKERRKRAIRDFEDMLKELVKRADVSGLCHVVENQT